MGGLKQLLDWALQLNMVLFFVNFAYQLAKRRLERATGRDEVLWNVMEHVFGKIPEGTTSVRLQATAWLHMLTASKDHARNWLVSLIPPKPTEAPVEKKQPCRCAELQEQVRQLQEQVRGHQAQVHQLRWALDEQEREYKTQNAELEESLALERADLAQFNEAVLVSQRHELEQVAAQQAATDGARIRDLEGEKQHLGARLRDHEMPTHDNGGDDDGSSLLAALKERTKQTRELQRSLAVAQTQLQDDARQLAVLEARHEALIADRDRHRDARARAEDQARAALSEGDRQRHRAQRLAVACVRLRAELRAEQERLGRGYMAEMARGCVPMEGVVAS